jgi:hypothetical protein
MPGCQGRGKPYTAGNNSSKSTVEAASVPGGFHAASLLLSALLGRGSLPTRCRSSFFSSKLSPRWQRTDQIHSTSNISDVTDCTQAHKPEAIRGANWRMTPCMAPHRGKGLTPVFCTSFCPTNATETPPKKQHATAHDHPCSKFSTLSDGGVRHVGRR